MEKNSKIPETLETLPIKESLEVLKTEIIEENARQELSKLGYGFIKKHDGEYLLTKEGNDNRPNMNNYSEALSVEIFNIDNLVELARFIEQVLQKNKDNLNPYLDSDSLTKAIYYRNSDAPKDIYNKENFPFPDSQIIGFSEIASLLGIPPENQEINKEYINDKIKKIMEFLNKIKINEKS